MEIKDNTSIFIVECGNWFTFIEVDKNCFERNDDMALEAMTKALENFLDGNHDDINLESPSFDSDGDEELNLGPFVTAFPKDDRANSKLCLVEYVLINAGRHDLAKIIKKVF
tara:strand:- start:1975 stop:2310 length:336 start_codon:yes stop_codon:yes gene_type:complete